ncbi:2,3-bisphosphoglycerate-independent phosphoglycerate mutase, partial [Candidatus Roizmanbacteria bacterium CG_4_9_14_0_8_um_filter_34_12]
MKKVALIVLDGWGVGENKENNAIYMAKPKFFNHLITNYPNTKLQASGELVGLPKGQIGGSEVGHLTMGAGRVLEESLTKINNTFSNLSSNNTILQIPTFQQFIKNAQQRPAHLVGLISTSGVHAHIQHLFSLLKVMKQQKCLSPNIHFISDGRDTST